jgi:thiamine pyrophosphokinase
MTAGTAIVLAGGDPVDPTLRTALPTAAFVVAADSGLHAAQALDLHVDVVIGDLDSVDPGALDAAVAAGTVVDRHPAEKDATDLELALDAAIERGANRLVVAGGAGGRLDHLLANLALFASPRFDDVEIEAHVGAAKVTVVHAGRTATLQGGPGSIVTLVPFGGDAVGISTRGLEYPLQHESLPSGTTRGVSNVMLATDAEVELERGTLLAVQPEGGVR